MKWMILDKNGQTKKRKRTKLSGTNLGFDLFDEILPEWISSKLEEISCEENKKIRCLKKQDPASHKL